MRTAVYQRERERGGDLDDLFFECLFRSGFGFCCWIDVLHQGAWCIGMLLSICWSGECNRRMKGRRLLSRITRVTFIAAIYFIWKERNRRLFMGRKRKLIHVWKERKSRILMGKENWT